MSAWYLDNDAGSPSVLCPHLGREANASCVSFVFGKSSGGCMPRYISRGVHFNEEKPRVEKYVCGVIYGFPARYILLVC